ncbi:hypothetical protein ACFC96_20000 [Streptomyces sp. NPDC055955]|uniref:hypothetical protein n=1 Tax=Streptomyces sp. NPDC055955 TaxID=3345665 RepID=UPI0035DF19ED
MGALVPPVLVPAIMWGVHVSIQRGPASGTLTMRARLAMSATSPVPVLDGLLRERLRVRS